MSTYNEIDVAKTPSMHKMKAGQFINQWVMARVSNVNRPFFYRAFSSDREQLFFLAREANTERKFDSLVEEAFSRHYAACAVQKPTFRDYLIFNPYNNVIP